MAPMAPTQQMTTVRRRIEPLQPLLSRSQSHNGGERKAFARLFDGGSGGRGGGGGGRGGGGGGGGGRGRGGFDDNGQGGFFGNSNIDSGDNSGNGGNGGADAETTTGVGTNDDITTTPTTTAHATTTTPTTTSLATTSLATTSLATTSLATTSLATTSLATTTTKADDGNGNRNGAQQLSSKPAVEITTTAAPAAPVAPASTSKAVGGANTAKTSISAAEITATTGLATAAPPTTTSATTSASAPQVTSSADSDKSGFRGHFGSGDSRGSADGSRTHRGNATSTTTSVSSTSTVTVTKALDSTAERALISVGSIGGFIVICFLAWAIVRAARKQKRKKNGADPVPEVPTPQDRPLSGALRLPYRVYNRMVEAIPFLRRRRKAWETLEGSSRRDSCTAIGGNNLMPSQAAQPFHYDEKYTETAQPLGFESKTPLVLPESAFLGYQSSGPFRSAQMSSLEVPPTYAGTNSTTVMGMPSDRSMMTSPGAQYLQPLQSLQPLQFASDSTIKSSASGTARSRMPHPFYNQSQMARQPSDAYDPAQRAVNRASELSELSSGFGDGVTVVLEQQQQQRLQHQEQQQQLAMLRGPPPIPDLAPPPPGRFSWVRSSLGRMSRRETVYTEASEDLPAKFRSVSSWVNQQTGRVRRGQASIDTTATSAMASSDDIGNSNGPGGGAAATTRGTDTARVVLWDTPGVPHPMPEVDNLAMMPDDGQEPRRPDTVPGIRII